MAGSSFFALVDDIATLLDDVAAMSKVAIKKTSGVLGDDLALNAEQVTGVDANRELPVVWAVAKGSALNKVILVPCAILLSYLAPWAIKPLLMMGGAFLCYEGFEKLWHSFQSKKEEKDLEKKLLLEKIQNAKVEKIEDLEKNKIKGAIRTDFILSAEIVVISLGTVAEQSLKEQFFVLATISVFMTIGVYGLVAAIVKMDDLGFYLQRLRQSFSQALGRGLIKVAPYLMKALSWAGTVAMFLVGGGLLTHGISQLHHIESALGDLSFFLPPLFSGLVGLFLGAFVLFAKKLMLKLKQAK